MTNESVNIAPPFAECARHNTSSSLLRSAAFMLLRTITRADFDKRQPFPVTRSPSLVTGLAVPKWRKCAACLARINARQGIFLGEEGGTAPALPTVRASPVRKLSQFKAI